MYPTWFDGFKTQKATCVAGNMRDMGSMFTLYWTQAFFDVLQGHKETDIVMLPRAGWVGTWRREYSNGLPQPSRPRGLDATGCCQQTVRCSGPAILAARWRCSSRR